MAPRNVMLCLVAVASLLCQTDAAAVTAAPIARVISLLGKLQAQVEKEGKKEAAEYDKYACYCKDQADDTLYAIEKSKEKIGVLSAAIKKLDGEIKDLDADIKDLTQTIKDKNADIKTAVEKRGKENDAYVKEAEEIADAIGAIEGAIKELKGSKDDMKKAKLNLLQDQLLEVLSLSATSPSQTQLSAIQALTQAPADPAKKHAYVYQSNDIIATLETLRDQFVDKKKVANMAEKEKLFAFEEKKQSLENERDFAEKDKTEKEGIREDKNTERSDKQKDHDAEDTAMKADDGYLKELTSDCEAQAEQFDQRSKVRGDELTAMSQAMDQLKGGVQENYGSNAMAGASFLQLRRGSSAVALAQVAKLVSSEALRLHSASLTGLALKLNMGGHFDKVVGLIKDLIKKIEDEVKAMADSQTFCDEGMKKAVSNRDKNKLQMEKETATIAMKKAERNELAGEVEKLSAEMASLNKALLEATELRNEEKANNKVTVAEAKEGKAAVDQAITVLKDFYSAQFLQESKGPAENRHGESIGGAPKLSYDGDYKGKQGASKGIIGILEVICSDFQKTISDTESDEDTAAGDFTSFEDKTNKDRADKNKLKGEKEDAIKAATSAITQAKDDFIDADTLMKTALEDLEKITAMCLTGQGTFAERKKAREEEAKSLKSAMKILEDWKAL